MNTTIDEMHLLLDKLAESTNEQEGNIKLLKEEINGLRKTIHELRCYDEIRENQLVLLRIRCSRNRIILKKLRKFINKAVLPSSDHRGDVEILCPDDCKTE